MHRRHRHDGAGRRQVSRTDGKRGRRRDAAPVTFLSFQRPPRREDQRQARRQRLDPQRQQGSVVVVSPRGLAAVGSQLSSAAPQVFITNGWMADLVVVVAVTDREAKTAAHGISLFLVEHGTKGFQKGRKLEKIGLKAQVPVGGGGGGASSPAGQHGSVLFSSRTRLSCSSRTCGSRLTPSSGT